MMNVLGTAVMGITADLIVTISSLAHACTGNAMLPGTVCPGLARNHDSHGKRLHSPDSMLSL